MDMIIDFVITAGLFIFGVIMIILLLVVLMPIIIAVFSVIFSKDFLGFVIAMIAFAGMLGFVSWVIS
jgi:hypothetical protein